MQFRALEVPMGTALASWRDGPAKAAVLKFVEKATAPGPGNTPEADRIAAFDNDGTLWVEQPLPPQFDFVFGRWAQEIKRDPSLATMQPYKAILARDPEFFHGIAAQDPKVIDALLQVFARSWAGTTPEQFDGEVRAWLATAKQPTLKLSYLDLVQGKRDRHFARVHLHQCGYGPCRENPWQP